MCILKSLFFAMRKITMLLLFGWAAGLQGQSIDGVDFEVLPGDLVEITYTIRDAEPNALYGIDIFASLDGGYSFPIHARSVSGDVGKRVRGAGRKTALWKVLDDMPALASENLVIKVTGRPRATVGAAFASLFVGNRLTKRLSNGVTFYGGSGGLLARSNPDFQGLIDDGTLKPANNYRFGLRITKVPLVYSFEGQYQGWDLNSSEAVSSRLKYMAYGDPRYQGKPVALAHTGFSATLAYTPLPIFGVILPRVGGGMGFYQFRLGAWGVKQVSTVKNHTLFAEIGMQVNLFRWFKVNAGLRQNFFSSQIDFSEGFVEIGFHIPTR